MRKSSKIVNLLLLSLLLSQVFGINQLSASQINTNSSQMSKRQSEKTGINSESKVNAKPQVGKYKASSCFTTALKFDKNSVYSGAQTKVTLSYENTNPACSAEELEGQTINIDFADLIDGGNLNNALAFPLKETDHLIPSVNGTVLTLTFKDLSTYLEPGEGLESYWGTFSLVINVKHVTEDTDVSINDDVTAESDITVLAPGTGGGGIDNTQKWPEKDYVNKGDYLKYTLRINNDWKHHDTFSGVDTLPRGMSLVENDPDHPIEIYREISTTNQWPDTSTGPLNSQFNIQTSPSQMKISSKGPIDAGYEILYWVHVDNEVASGEYTNSFAATYDDKEEDVNNTVSLASGGSDGEDGAGSYIDLHKNDQFGNPVAGATFTINDGTKNVETITTDENGYAKSKEHKFGTYSVKEKAAPSGYTINPTRFIVDLEIDGETVHVNDNEPIIDQIDSGYIDLNKVDEENNKLSGAEFDIYDNTGALVDHVISNELGYAKSKELPLGDYTLKETKAPNGFVLPSTEYKVTIDSNKEVAHVNGDKPIVNNYQKAKLDILKVDETGKGLPNAEFSVKDSSGKLVDSLLTDTNGKATSKNLKLGTYTVSETKAPEGYINDGATFTIDLTEANSVLHVNDGNGIINKQIHGKVDLYKVDEVNKPLKDAEFTIYNLEGKAIEKLTTDSNGYALSSNLPYGQYIVKETKAPSGYSINKSEFPVDIKQKGITHLNSGKPIIDTKEIPWEPLTPSEPIVPWEPLTPSEPIVPWEPLTPSEPIVPWEPLTPSEPIVPWEPLTPSEPIVPWEPLTPSEPIVPWEPLTPSNKIDNIMPHIINPSNDTSGKETKDSTYNNKPKSNSSNTDKIIVQKNQKTEKAKKSKSVDKVKVLVNTGNTYQVSILIVCLLILISLLYFKRKHK